MALQDLFRAWASRGFADFPGLSVEGSIPVKQDLVNQLLAEALASPAGKPADLGSVLPLLKKVEVAATDGVITIHFQVRI